jgi:23S rRNA (cytidine2498-2'-O)-methyltransferase
MATRRRPPPPSLRTLSKAQAKIHEKRQEPKRSRRPSRFIYVGSPEAEAALTAELGVTARAIAGGVVGADVDRDPIFARQVLRAPHALTAPTRDDLAKAIVAFADAAEASPRAVHVFCPEVPRVGSARRSPHPLQHEADRLQETLDAKLDGRRQKGKLGPATAHILQVLMVGVTDVVVSVDVVGAVGTVDARGDALASWPVPFPGGKAVAENEKDAPSSAHRKLEEATRWLGVVVGADDVVVDLGAAPGGWTRVMRDAGATVVAVDRAELDAALQRDPKVTHLKKDALSLDLSTFNPTVVLCDVIWTPDNAVVIAERVLKLETCRAAVITLKLKEPLDEATLARAQRLVRDLPSAWTGRLKHLVANKLEVTLLLRRGASQRA